MPKPKYWQGQVEFNSTDQHVDGYSWLTNKTITSSWTNEPFYGKVIYLEAPDKYQKALVQIVEGPPELLNKRFRMDWKGFHNALISGKLETYLSTTALNGRFVFAKHGQVVYLTTYED